MPDTNRKTSKEHWDSIYAGNVPKLKLPSRLVVSTRDLQNLLASTIKPADRVLEIGFAPGKQLAFVAKILGASVSGLDYAPQGIATANRLFKALKLEGEFRCEDVFSTTFPKSSFDVTYSVGVVEHFDDPREIIRKHVELLKPGGTALIIIPNYSGIYGRMQNYFDPDNLLIHNLEMMSCPAMEALAPVGLAATVEAFDYGRVNPWLISLDRKIPSLIAKGVNLFGNLLGLIQPFKIRSLCPMIVLKVTRK